MKTKILTLGFISLVSIFLVHLPQQLSSTNHQVVAHAQEISAQMNPNPLSQIPRTPIPCTIKDGFTFAAVGDLIGPGRPVGPLKDPEFEQVAKIIRDADVAFANNEGGIFDIEKFKGYPAAQNGGGDPVGVAAVATDLKAMGFDMVSKANNHATDWGIEGLQETERVLDEAGIVHAGSGRDRPSARLAAYLETSHGRIALVSAASTFNPASVAGLAVGEAPGRPGISALRTRCVALVTADEMAVLRSLAARYGRPGAADAKQVNILGQVYRLADKAGLTYEMNPYDHYEILQAIRGAKQTSDLTVFTIHAHETGSGRANDPIPGDFLPPLLHNAVDAGADIVVVHGQHVVRGIEIYKDKPIFYSLASFFYHMDMDRAPTREAFEEMNLDPNSVTYSEYLEARFGKASGESFESVIAVSEFEGGEVKEVRLYPLDLRAAAGSQRRGVPMLASPEVGQRILERIRSQSIQFGTEIQIEDNIGIIKVNK
jgi:poly-gamma-glutamate synthesis protein (capsule biosynthesis protein)